MRKKPAEIVITIRTEKGEVTLTRRQAATAIGHFTESATEALNAVVADARTWLRRNA